MYELGKDQANYLFQSISGSKATDWKFQSVKYLHELVQQYGGKKSGVKKQNSEKGFEKNEHACIVVGVLYKLPARLGKFKARLSSDRSERETQKSLTRRWGLLA